jgi:hypothetical protein
MPELAIAGLASDAGKDGAAMIGGISDTVGDVAGAGVARCDRAPRCDELNRGSFDAGVATGSGVGKLALALNVVCDVCAAVKLHA